MSSIGGVLITGGGGFIGSAVRQRLVRAGVAVDAGVRRPETGSVPCDLDRPEQVHAAVAGRDAVVHAAYGDVAAMAGQMRTVCAAMSAYSVRHLVYFSSIAVYGSASGRVDEALPLSQAPDAYGRAKQDCEAIASAWASADAARRLVILRPGIVYGAGSYFWREKLAQRIASGKWGTFGPHGEGFCAAVHVDDVADAVLACLRRLPDADASTTTCNVVGPELLTWNTYFSSLAASFGASTLRDIGQTELKALQARAILTKVGLRLGLPLPKAWALAPSAGEMALFARQGDYRSHALERFCGFTPQIILKDGLAR